MQTQNRKYEQLIWKINVTQIQNGSQYWYYLSVVVKQYQWGPSWSCGSLIYNYLCNQCLSPLKLCEFQPCSWWGVLDTTLRDKVCQWLVTSRWFSAGTLVSFINKTDCHDRTEILLKVALNTINLNLTNLNKLTLKRKNMEIL